MAKAKKKQKEHVSRKELIYRGKTLEDLKKLDVRESAKFLKSRSRRSVLRNFDQIQKFLMRCEKKKAKNKKIKTHLRDLVIVPKLVGSTISVYTGKTFQDIPITIEMIGHRLGEFAPTRGKVSHGSAGIGATKSSRAQKK
jgi:small subunit ribosomal protein S19